MRVPAFIPITGAALAACVLASPAAAAPAGVTVKNDSFTPKSVAVSTGEAVTWNFMEGGHNIDVSGPETFKSTNGTDKSGTSFSHTFNTPGDYQYICDYHGSMKGTVTVTAAPPPSSTPPPSSSPPPSSTPAPSPSPEQPGGLEPSTSLGTPQPVDSAPPTLGKLRFRGSTLRVQVSEAGRLVVRYVRAGARGHVVHKRIVRARKGTVRLKLRRWMRAGRYRVHVMAFDAAGNASRPARTKLSLRPRNPAGGA